MKQSSLTLTASPTTKLSARHTYRPNLGYIGSKRVSTSNYLFHMHDDTLVSHSHARGLLETFLKRSPEEHYVRSESLTEFIRKRGLTFSKKLDNGESRIFTVPVTSSIVPLAKSMFNQLEKNAQSLVMTLRWILQGIYGAEKPEDSAFIRSLPEDVREIFVRTIYQCPQYFAELHHPAMADYPFFEVVGLDLVLVDEYIRANESMFAQADPHELPFKLLELNAGAPSGASNNASVLEGLLEVDPDFAKITERVMPNDHFDVLRATFDSIGRDWTKDGDGISVILPPGGTNGAAPEIHQLAAYSGMPYIEASMLYIDGEGLLRLRTLSGENPRVTSIYSRVNADSAMYDPKRGIFMRDAETGEALYQEDPLTVNDAGPKTYLKDRHGNPVPMESVYAIPEAISLVHSRKLYLGGLNRVLDNKLILSTLTHFGPRFYQRRLAELGLTPDFFMLTPPETLPPAAESVAIIRQNPDDWVIKAPDLSGGTGVHILLTLPEKKKRAVLAEVDKNPTQWAYQKLVRIARIPVARKDNGKVRFANLAADIRMWCFFGAGESFAKPRLTHNGLVRFAPHEKGSLSSIVNTSKGGGYAPLLVIDDIGTRESIPVLEMTAARTPPTNGISTPTFIGAQIYQISRMLQRGLFLLSEPEATASDLLNLGLQIKKQTNEVLSYFSPKNVEPLSAFLYELEKRTSERKIKRAREKHVYARAKLIENLIDHERSLSEHFFAQLRKLHCMRDEFPVASLGAEWARQDRARIAALLESEQNSETAREACRLISNLTRTHLKDRPVSERLRISLRSHLEAYAEMALDRLSRGEDRDLAYLFSLGNLSRQDRMDTQYRPLLPLFAHDQEAPIATLWELQNRRSLIDSATVSAEIREAHGAWTRMRAQVDRLASKLSRPEAETLLERKRAEHFGKYPFLAEIQRLIDVGASSDPADLLKILEVLPYSKYNIQQYLKRQNLSFEQLFSKDLQHGRVALLTPETLANRGMNPYYAGECFARKRETHGLFSNSDIVTWVSTGTSPFIQAYTLGHELIHFYQIEEIIRSERLAMNKGSLDFAEFLNFYGNFLGSSVPAIERIDENTSYPKATLFGIGDLAEMPVKTPLVRKLIRAYRKGDESFEQILEKSGALLSWMVPTGASFQVKAVREAIPCLENAKNIRFAKDLGLRVWLDEARSALPAANETQLRRYRRQVEKAAVCGGADLETLEIIAHHQFHGVRAELNIRASYDALYLGGSYNSAQQQQ